MKSTIRNALYIKSKTSKTDRFYTYVHIMKINRTLNLCVQEHLFIITIGLKAILTIN